MIKCIYFLVLTALLVIVSFTIDLSSRSGQINANTNGAPNAKTGSPGDGGNCTNCHNSTAITTPGLITSNIPASGYIPGQTYTITATVTGVSTKFGMQISPQKTNGNQVGTLVNTSSQTTLSLGTKYINHNNTGTSGNGSKTWTFNWIAPAAGTGSFSFYGAFNISNSNNSSSGDNIVLSSLLINEAATTPITANASGTNVSCNNSCNGSATVVANGGNGTLSYSWNTTPVQTTQTATNLCPGTYTCTVSDGTGQTATASYTVTAPSLLTSSVVNVQNVSCFGANNGTASVTATGGTPPYTYFWSGNASSITNTASNLGPGVATVTVTDANGCTSTANATITQPSALTASQIHSDVSCNGLCDGSINATVSGGTSPYIYSWSNGSSTEDLTNLCAGNYSLSITDNRGCIASLSSPVTVIQPSPFDISQTHIDNTCAGSCNASINLSVLGGSPPYTYSWNSGQTTEDIQGLCNGSYTVSIRDNNNCQGNLINAVQISSPDPLVVNAGVSGSVCAGVLVTIGGAPTANGGTGPYTYSWSPNTNLNNSEIANPTFTANSDITYLVSVSDANQCQGSASISFLVTEQGTAVISANGPTSICEGDSLQLNASFGLSYIWEPTGQTTPSIFVTQAGNYSATIESPGGCSGSSISNSISISVNPVPTIPLITENGTTLSTSGGDSYQWYIDGIPVDNATGPIYTANQNGIISVESFYSNGCSSLSADYPFFSISIAENSSSISFYPNPVNDILTIKNADIKQNEIHLFSLTGQEKLIRLVNGDNSSTNLDLSSLEKGVYLLQIKTSKTNLIKRLIKN